MGGDGKASSGSWDFRVLGPLEVEADGETVSLGGAKQRALLAVLLLNANQVVSTDRLIDDLWGEAPPATSSHTIQVYVSQLRKAIEPVAGAHERLLTRPPGYVLRVGEGELDLERFERLAAEGVGALAAGRADAATEKLREALGLWRGPALPEFAFEPFAQTAIARLEELRLAALEARIEADLALGGHASLVGELEGLVKDHPVRERLRGHLMLALYRSGRQAEALEAYQTARTVLVDELGIDPSPALQALERAILRQDPELDAPPPAAAGARSPTVELPAPRRSILTVALRDHGLDALVALAAPLARTKEPHELILTRLVGPDEGPGALADATTALRAEREGLAELGVPARVAAFTSEDPGHDLVRLASEQDVDLLLVDARKAALGTEAPSGELRTILEEAPSDVALLVGPDADIEVDDGTVAVPFGGAEHDWAALELGAWLASARGSSLKLIGTAADPERGKRDASRLLASASLVVQQLAGVATEPALVEPGSELLAEAAAAALLVFGFPDRWRKEGIGLVRAEMARAGMRPALAIRRGVRPGGLTPRSSLTRFTWSLAGAAS